MTKICKDCKHYRSGAFDPVFGMAQCMSPAIRQPNLITGELETIRYSTCASQRVAHTGQQGDCGPLAQHYQPSIIKRIKDKIGGAK